MNSGLTSAFNGLSGLLLLSPAFAAIKLKSISDTLSVFPSMILH